MKKKTAVSIVSSKEQTKQEVVKVDKKGGGTEKKEKKPLSEKMVKLIDELALLSLEENATYSDVVSKYTEIRSGYAKKQINSFQTSNSDQNIQRIFLQENAYLIMEISTAKQLVRYIS